MDSFEIKKSCENFILNESFPNSFFLFQECTPTTLEDKKELLNLYNQLVLL